MEILTVNVDILHRDPNTYQKYASNFKNGTTATPLRPEVRTCVVNLKINHWSQFYACRKRLLHNKFSNKYLSKYNSDSLDYKCQHMATILWTINASTTGRDLVCYVNRTIAIHWSMSQTGHNPHGYKPMNFQRHYHRTRSCLLCQLDNSNLLINVSNSLNSDL